MVFTFNPSDYWQAQLNRVRKGDPAPIHRLRTEGASWQEIAEIFDVSLATLRDLYRIAISKGGVELHLRTVEVRIDIEAEEDVTVDADLVCRALDAAPHSGWRVAGVTLIAADEGPGAPLH